MRLVLCCYLIISLCYHQCYSYFKLNSFNKSTVNTRVKPTKWSCHVWESLRRVGLLRTGNGPVGVMILPPSSKVQTLIQQLSLKTSVVITWEKQKVGCCKCCWTFIEQETGSPRGTGLVVCGPWWLWLAELAANFSQVPPPNVRVFKLVLHLIFQYFSGRGA